MYAIIGDDAQRTTELLGGSDRNKHHTRTMVRDKDNDIDMCGNQAHGQCEWLCRSSVVFVAKAQRGHWSSRSPVPLLLVQVVPGVPRIRDQHRVTVKGNPHRGPHGAVVYPARSASHHPHPRTPSATLLPAATVPLRGPHTFTVLRLVVLVCI